MADIEFDDDGRARFLTRHHGEASLSQAKWSQICARPERYHYRLNGDKVATALIAPDLVRCHDAIATQYLYYKRFPKWQIAAGIEGPNPLLMTVVIDEATKRVCTVYPVRRPKEGKEYKP